MLKLNQIVFVIILSFIITNSTFAQPPIPAVMTGANHLFKIDASNSSWTNTGLQLNPGEEFIFWSIGWYYLEINDILLPKGWSSPDGHPFRSTEVGVGFSAGTLIAKIGSNENEFAIGSFASYRAEVSGTLYLKVFDHGTHDNNFGEAIVLVYGPIQRPPTTGLQKINNADRPTNYSLSQNYPNPFNPTCIINYGIQQIGDVEIDVYNSLGQKVKTLVNELKNPGEYSVIWDGTDEHQNPLSSGQYFYTLKVGDFVSTKKMILLK